MNFLKQFISNPIKTGAVASSSKQLTKLIVDSADVPSKKCVVELGCGSGVFTKEILNKLSTKALFFCLEINPKFVAQTKKLCPKATVYEASALEIQKYLKKNKRKTCDTVISGLPWAMFDKQKQEELLAAVYESLGKGGTFLTFAYLQGRALPTGKKFQKLLNETFSKVEVSDPVWKNIPPAIVYKCTK